MKYYAVRKGRKPGIYTSWNECKEQTHKFAGAVYKSFENLQEAEEFLKQEKKTTDISQFLIPLTAYTDGSFDPKTNHGGWGYVLLDGGEPCLKAYGPSCGDLKTRNITAELEAAKESIEKAHELGADYLRIHHDYEGVGRWADGDWATNNPETIAFVEYVRKMREKLTIEFEKVKGHSSDTRNNEADELAAKGVKAAKKVEVWCGEMAADDNIEMNNTEAIPPEDNAPFFGAEEAGSVEEQVWEMEMQMPDEEPEEPYFEPPKETSTEFVMAEPIPDEPKAPNMPFHIKLAQMREAKMLTKSGVAKATGCSQYARMESGEDIKITRAILRNIYDALHGQGEDDFASFVAAWANS